MCKAGLRQCAKPWIAWGKSSLPAEQNGGPLRSARHCRSRIVEAIKLRQLRFGCTREAWHCQQSPLDCARLHPWSFSWFLSVLTFIETDDIFTIITRSADLCWISDLRRRGKSRVWPASQFSGWTVGRYLRENLGKGNEFDRFSDHASDPF